MEQSVAVAGPSCHSGLNHWYKGKIHSIETKDFVTYDHVVYYPGPYLNVIVGPNGTGKSTLVAAIVLGMGGQPKTLSRSQHIGDYVKNGKERAEIEIVLYTDSKHKSTFKRTFTIKGQNKFYFNNTECTLKRYVEFVAQFNIQINNLCQFLPQDRVQDFAKMNSQEILNNTQSSVCSAECVDMFEKLKQLRAEQKDEGRTLATRINKLTENEGKAASLKEQVDNINLKSKLTEVLDICTKKKAWMEFEELFLKFKEIENDLKKGNENKKRAEDELAPLNAQANQIDRLKETYQRDIKTETDKTQSFVVELNKLDEKSCKYKEAIVKAEGDLKFAIESQEENKKEYNAAILKQMALIEDVKRSVAIAGSENDKKAQFEEIARDRSKYADKVRLLSDLNRKKIRQLNEEINPSLHSVKNKIQNMENSKNTKLELLRTKFDQVYQGVMWLRQNKSRFKGNIYEPMILELNVKEGFSKYFENVISIRDLVAFPCENKDDMEKLFTCLRTELGLEVNIIFTKPVRAVEFSPPPISQIKKFGFQHFLLELVDGPETLLNYLCSTYRIHAVPIGNDQTLSMAEKVPQQYPLFFTTNHRISSLISQYSNQRSSECQEILSRNLLNVTVDYGALENLKRQREEITKSSDKCRNEQGRIEAEIKEFEVKINDLDTRKGQIESKFYNVEVCKRTLQRHIKLVKGLEASAIDLDKENEKFKKMTTSSLKSLSDTQKQKFDLIIKLRISENAMEYHRKKHRVFLKSTAILESQIAEAKEKLNTAIRYVNNIKTALDDAKEKCKRQQAIACQLTDNKKPSDARNFPYKQQFDELPDTMEDLVDHMNAIQGQMECVRNFNPEVIAEYENLIRDIELLKSAIESAQSNQSNLDNQMDTIYEKWNEIISKVVGEIDDRFSKFMTLMGFAGEVKMAFTGRDYDGFGLNIGVKFRNMEQMQYLDRFVQSGGERAVAIAAYTLSLQHMSHVPFRCVDEINQGMDPRNERKIFDMLVTETSEPGKAQFFFVTPKLLLDLSYNDYMTVSVVFNGRFVTNSSVFQQFNKRK